MKTDFYDSPIGRLWLSAENGALTGLSFSEIPVKNDGEEPVLSEAKRQLDEYFSGKRFVFTVPIFYTGTPFQTAVWVELQKIPYGETRTYGEIAAAIGKPKASRAVGMACHRNPIGIMIPCHRVIGKTGALTGFGGGLDKKQALLEREKIED